MALGNYLNPNQQTPIHPALAQAMNPQGVAQGGQQAQQDPGMLAQLGQAMQGLKNNPAAIQMLLQTGSTLLNPQSFQAPGGRIASAISQGVSGYNDLNRQAEESKFRRELLEGREEREDRKVDLTEQQMETESDQWLKSFGLKEEEFGEQKKTWEAQRARWAAEAEALRMKAERGGSSAADLTGPERIINNLAKTLEGKGVPSDRAYTMAFDIYNKSSEGEAKAVAGAYESLGMLASTPKGKELLDSVVEQIEKTFRSGTDVLDSAGAQQPQQPAQQQQQEVAPGVMATDIQAALQAINQNDGTNLTWDQLNGQQKAMVIRAIQQRKGGGQ